jgi:ABC-type nickel/cobalt efflux system permease component RcnA
MERREHISKLCQQAILIFGSMVLMISCGVKEKPNEELQQAFRLHQEAVKIRNQVEENLKILNANEDSLFINVYRSKLDSIRLSLITWDEQLVEVPGFEEEHDHSGHDHHHHDDPPELSSEQHLEVQQFLLDEIRRIEKDINQIQGSQ